MCGCDSRRGEGYSSSRRQCAVGSTTEAHEACACARRSAAGGAAKDACGCTACSGEGWSSSQGKCAPGSHTDGREASACQSAGRQVRRGPYPQSGEGDMCGCDSRRGEGYSSSRRQCAVGSTTEAHEACACARRSAAGGAAKDVCGCTACSGEGWSSSRGQCAPGSHTDAREASACEQRAGAGTLAPPGGLASDCAQRLGVHYEASSACVVKRNDEALLVWVPYDSAPGWDLPGGMKNSGESACETAERETCEETGFQVRAVEKLSGNVFRCEIVSANKCTNAVDEGFLKKKWATKADLGSLQYRGGTWGNKQGFLRQTLQG